MAKQIVANIRKSSSLIVLARDKIKAEKQTDYKLSLLTQGTGKKSDIFTKENPESLERELSLRIATVREAFEELGVIFCRDRKSLTDGSDDGYGKFKEDFDRQHWQKLVHDDATQFLKLCETLEIVPDLWSLYEWSNWVTPATFKKRFNAAFFVIVLKTIPDLIKEKHEVSEFAWKTPAEYLQQHFKKEIWLPPPQFYELSRLLNYSELEQFKKFAQKRSAEGLEAILPIERKCNDSRVNLLPGDDLYDNPNSSTDLVPTHKTAKEYRNGVKNLHRIEFYDSNDMVVQLNFKPPHGHLTPINTNPKKHE